MTKQQAREFVDRWSVVEQVLIQEVRRITPELRTRQIATAYQAAKAMPPKPDEIPFAKWQSLREKFSG